MQPRIQEIFTRRLDVWQGWAINCHQNLRACAALVRFSLGDVAVHNCLYSTRGGKFLPGIRVKDGESFESALRRFKKKCEKAGILSDLRRHQHFEKPSERRKRKMNAAKRKNIARRELEA